MSILDKLSQYKTALNTLNEGNEADTLELEKRLAEAKGNTTGDYLKAGLSKLGDAFGYALDSNNPVTTSFWGQLKEAEKGRVDPIQKELDRLRKMQQTPLEQLNTISNIEYKEALSDKARKSDKTEAEKEQARIDRENRQYYKRVKSTYNREKGKASDGIKSVLDKLLTNEKKIDEVADGSFIGRIIGTSDKIDKNTLKNDEVKARLKEAAYNFLQKKGKYKTTLSGKLSDDAIADIVDKYVEARSQGKKVSVDEIAKGYMQQTRGDLVDELNSLAEYAPQAAKANATKKTTASTGTKKRYVWNSQTGRMEAK